MDTGRLDTRGVRAQRRFVSRGRELTASRPPRCPETASCVGPAASPASSSGWRPYPRCCWPDTRPQTKALPEVDLKLKLATLERSVRSRRNFAGRKAAASELPCSTASGTDCVPHSGPGTGSLRAFLRAWPKPEASEALRPAAVKDRCQPHRCK